MRNSTTASVVAALALSLAVGCVLVERPPEDWPEPETNTPPAYVELVRRCRSISMRRGDKANHAIRADTVLLWAGGASLAGGAVTATLAGLDTRQREGVIGAAVVTTITAGVALGTRFVASPTDQRERYAATRAHEHAANQGLWLLDETTAWIAAWDERVERQTDMGPTLSELYRYQAELHDYVRAELSSCVAVDPRAPPAPLPPAPEWGTAGESALTR